MKKALSVLLAAVTIALTVIPCFAADANDDFVGGYNYSITNGEVRIDKYHDVVECEITIPATIEGYPVTSIGESAFYECKKLSGVTVPDTVTEIGRCAFMNCKNLIRITLPDSIERIGTDAFYGTMYSGFEGYYDDQGVLYIGNHLITAIPEKLKGEYKIKEGTICIADEAFDRCNSLTSVIVPDGVRNIGKTAFNSSNPCIESFVLPKSLESVFEDSFYGRTTPCEVYYAGTEEDWKKIEISEPNPDYLSSRPANAFEGANIHYNSTGPEDDSPSFFDKILDSIAAFFQKFVDFFMNIFNKIG